jgi:alkylhydroperoxidase family enzyme
MSEPTSHPLALRTPLSDAVKIAHSRIAAPGTWLSGATRVAIAAETRHATQCSLCRQRKDALSPSAIDGEHDSPGDSLGDLSPAMTDVVHRLVTDTGRLTEKWLSERLADGISEEEYVEIIGVVATQVGLDTLNHAIGAEPVALPVPQAGTPSRKRPRGARKDLAWVATLSPETIEAGDPPIFARHGSVNIHRALSLVPQEAINFFDLDVELYLKDDEIRDFDNEYREISHAQIELIAGRTSFLNGCYY